MRGDLGEDRISSKTLVLEEAARLADLPADRVTEVIEIREEMFRL